MPVEGLSNLSIRGFRLEVGGYWPRGLTVKSRNALRELDIGHISLGGSSGLKDYLKISCSSITPALPVAIRLRRRSQGYK